MPPSETPQLQGFVSYLRHVLRRVGEDRCLQAAGALTYTTLLAMVPVMAVGFAIFSAFPKFAAIKAQAQDFIFENFAPHAGESVRVYLDKFLANAGDMTTVGVLFLVLSAVLLLSTIEQTFNVIWRAKGKRPLTVRLLAYWAILTLGPLLFGASLSVSSYMWSQVVAAGTDALGSEAVAASSLVLARLITFAMEIAGFSVMYLVLPHATVPIRHALIGATTAAVLFEVLKTVFGIYVQVFAGYQTIYGAMATVPLFLLWLHLSWTVALLGGIVTSSLGTWKGDVQAANDTDEAEAQPS